MQSCEADKSVGRSLFLIAILLAVSTFASAEPTFSDAARTLPDAVGDYKSVGPASPDSFRIAESGEFGPGVAASRIYRNESGASIAIEIVRTQNDAAAYALLTGSLNDSEEVKPETVGLAAIIRNSSVIFFKGDTLAAISWTAKGGTSEQLISLAQTFAATLPSGDDEIPILVKHLPDWQKKIGRATYAVTLPGLKKVVANQPILDSVSFDGGTEAVIANYDQSQLVIVEFTTPQFSIDNDQRITAKIQELKAQGQPVPTGYRRVGNYSVFVFNSADERTANQLIDQVKYQQVVQWLGEDPHLYEKLRRYFANTTTGVFISVLESSGLSLLICLGLGALIGTFLFRYRRSQQAAVYSDAGGQVRLNLDELTPARSHKLIGNAKKQSSDSRQL